jgi:eukaryotic-like serine/threonine-protein kinase
MVFGAPDSPSIIGKYHLIAQLGQGGMATVHLASAQGPVGFHKLIVVKVLRHDLTVDNRELCQMFLDEARLAARMQHPNVVQTLEAGEDDGRVYLVMEYLEGQPLNLLLRRAKQKPGLWSLHVHIRVLAEALRGLHYAHELRDYDGTPLGVVHRDVSPHNVFVTYDGQIKLVDFGVAKIAASEQQTQAGVLKGKIGYMAPEQVEGARFDRRADIFAAGVMLYEALCGERLWQGLPDATIFRHLLEGKIPDIYTAAPKAPRRLRDACAKALAVNPGARFRTAAEMQRELEQWLETSVTRASARQTGRTAALLFDIERHELRKLIDRRLKAFDAAGSPVGASSLPPASVPPQGAMVSSSRNSSVPPAPTTNLPQSARPWPLIEGTRPGTPRSTSAISLAQAEYDAILMRRAMRSGGIAGSSAKIALIATIALVGGGIALLRVAGVESMGSAGTEQVAAAAAPSQSAPSVVPIPSVVAPDPTVVLNLRAVPSSAVWFLDGVPLPSNPHSAALPRSSTVRRLRVQATGYVPLDREFVPDRDANFEVVLEAMRKRRPRPPVETVSSPSGDPDPDVDPGRSSPVPTQPRAQEAASSAGARRAPHGVDSANPYVP